MNTEVDNVIESDTNKIIKLLEYQCKGGDARLYHFTASHDRLTIGIKTENFADKELFLILLFCDSIELPVAWRIKRLKISKVDVDIFSLTDEGVSVLFRDCQLHSSY